MENYNLLIDGKSFYDQPINDLMRQQEEVRKASTREGENYATGRLLDYAYFKYKCRLILVI